jgi:ATP-dependent 26S proteasome regulatory subunit
MTADFAEEFYLHLKADYPIIFVLTQEETRAHKIIEETARRLDRKVVIPREFGLTASAEELLTTVKEDRAIVVFDNVHRLLDDSETLRVLSDLSDRKAARYCSAVVLAPWVDLPPELERISAITELTLPRPVDLKKVFNEACVEYGVIHTEEDIEEHVRAAQGLTLDEAMRAFGKAMVGWPEDATKSLESVARDKQRSLRRSRVLESVNVPVNMDDVGGLDQLKEWLASRDEAFTDRAREFGLPAPRGLLLMGVQGCGKSLTSKAVAGHWRLPLVRLDLSAVYGADRPEQALRNALRVAEAMSPMVLWIDEIEKGFDRSSDGPGSRLLGGMVTWLQEKTAEVFVVATANRVTNLPPELPRKGRFDEIFFVNLPNFHERYEILKIHLKKRGRNPDSFALEALAKKADKLTGSELEQMIIAAMYSAFSRDVELTDDDMLRALKETVPLYDTFESEIKALREWARKRARPASTDRRKIDLFAENRDEK